jgi:hypothetical protein
LRAGAGRGSWIHGARWWRGLQIMKSADLQPPLDGARRRGRSGSVEPGPDSNAMAGWRRLRPAGVWSLQCVSESPPGSGLSEGVARLWGVEEEAVAGGLGTGGWQLGPLPWLIYFTSTMAGTRVV